LPPRSSRLVLLPGLGGDERLFEPQRDAFPDLEVPAWIEPLRGETLAAYAARMAQGVGAGGPLYLGGVSFGGIVALEMARHLKPRAVFLIASCASRSGIPAWARVLGPFVRLLPRRALHLPQAAAPWILRRFGQLSPAQQDLFFSLMLRAPADFLRWGILATLGWSPAGLPDVPVHQIHGSDDTLLPVRLAEPQHVVAGAGHLVNFTHAGQVNAILRAHMQQS